MSRQLSRGGYRRFVIYDPTDLDTKAQIRDALPPSTIQRQHRFFQAASGVRRVRRRQEVLTLPITDFDPIYVARRFADQETKVNGILLGFERHVQFYENTFADWVPSHAAPGSLNADALTLWNSLRDSDVFHNHSLTAYKGWADDDSDGVADGWTISDEDSSTFTDDVQEITSSSQMDFQLTVPFPIDGIQLRFVVDVTQVHPSADTTLRIEARNSSGTATSSAEESVSSTGDSSVSLTTDSDTVEVRVIVRTENHTSSGTVKFQFPSLVTPPRSQSILA